MSDAPGYLVIRVPCGEHYQANLLGAIAWVMPPIVPGVGQAGPAQQVLRRLEASVRDAEYVEEPSA